MMGRDSSESALEELERFFVVYLVYDLLLLSPLTVFLLLFFFWFAGLKKCCSYMCKTEEARERGREKSNYFFDRGDKTYI